MSERPTTSYDELPYTSHPLHVSHPENLAAKAVLHGLRPPEVRSCRYLEIGCSTGGNLIPLAQLLPEARFVGLDHAARQIDQGTAVVQSLGLQNLQLRALGVEEADESFGEFDYIVCHGVFSWVAPPIQQGILSLIGRLLSPQGVAYVSYNTYPGWHLRGMVRELLLRQIRARGDAEKQVQHARAYLEFLAESSPDRDGVYARLLRQEVDLLRRTPDTYLFHEHLEDVNLPLYFSQFVQQASAHGLQFLSEASYSPLVANFAPELQARLDQLARDRIEYEQQLDFVCGGTFRRTLLCRAGLNVLARPSAQTLRQLRLASRAEPVDRALDVSSSEPAEFRSSDGASITSSHPLVKASLVALGRVRPGSIPFDELVDAAYRATGRTNDPLHRLRDVEMLASALLRCHECGIVETHLVEPPLVAAASERPVAFRGARFQAAHQEAVSNLRHRLVDLNDVDRYVLALLDGVRDRRSLQADLVRMTRDGTLVLHRNGQPIGPQDAELETFVGKALELSLRKMADLALLES